MQEELLKPELAEHDQEPIYSVRAGFIVAFFGGPIATVLFSGLNSRKLGRLSRDLPIYLIVTLITFGILALALAQPELFGGDSTTKPSQNVRVVIRVLALAAFGVFYFLHRSHYRAQELLGNDPPSPWVAGIACALLAMGLSVGGTVVVGVLMGIVQ